MSSTTNVQNFLVNVFRPVYTYDPTTTSFTPKLELSNIDTYSGNTISVITVGVGDSNDNVYVGTNAGNPYTTTNTKLCSNVTAVGYGAGSSISNVSNSTYLGFNAGNGALSASNVVAIGANTNGNGISNVYVGTGTGGGGNSNVFLGAGTTGTGTGSILIGPGLSDGSANAVFKLGQTYLTGNMTTKWLGLGTTSPYNSNNKLDVSGNMYVLGQVGINMGPERTFDVNGDFRASDASGTLDFFNGITSSSNGFASIRGTTTVSGGATTIGVIKKGVILISAVETSDSSKYAARHVIANTTSNLVNIGSNVTATASITSSTSNIQITDVGNGTYDWSITYFPV